MGRLVFDTETDAFLEKCTRMHILAAYNLDTQKIKYWLEGDLGWQEEFNNASLLVGHHAIAFDEMVLKKLFNYKLPKTCKIHDTLLMSQLLNYKRFGEDGHSLEVWGISLNYPKIFFNDWSVYTEVMKDRCLQDVRLTVKVYEVLLAEARALIIKNPNAQHYLKAEHYVSKWCAEANYNGWPFDLSGAIKLFYELEESMNLAYAALSSKLGNKAVAVDRKKGEVEVKAPKWTKQGFYDLHTARWFGIDPCSGYEGEERLVVGEYCRVEFRDLSLDSVADVKIFLFRNGWEPTEWNVKINEEGRRTQTSPKITDDSIEFLGGDGKLYTDFLTTKSRHGILKTWIENVDTEGMLHGDCMTIGTSSMRSRHTIIVNVPTTDSPWGSEMRKLFRVKPGWKLIGCDSVGNQIRGLAHYLGNQEFINTLLNKDIHQYNADILTNILLGMGIIHTVPRSNAKRILYATLFGAAGPKLWSYIFGPADEKLGRKLKNNFIKAVPGFEELTEKLTKIYSKTSQYGYGYIPSIAGNRIYVDSYHKLLVYLLQSVEKITCAAAIMLTMDRLEEEKIPYIPCIFYHDEIDFQVPEEYSERAAAIGKQAFADGPKLFGITIMDGEAKIGDSWFDVH